MLSPNPLPLSAEQSRWYAQAKAKLDPERLKQLLVALTDIHSPTGSTAAASQFMGSYFDSIGLKSRYLPMSPISGNVMGELKGTGGGATLLLYAPIDTHLERTPDEDDWVGAPGFVDLQPRAQVLDDWVYGLGSSNPKAMVAGLTEIATALVEAEVPLLGDLILGMADGGMPVDIEKYHHAGMSHGVLHLLNRGAYPDFAVIMKPLNAVFYEEPGMAWIKLRVHGTLGYAGVERGTPGFRSAIVPAAIVIEALDAWLVEYAERNTSGQIKPHSWISAVRSGDPQRPAFPSAITEIVMDLRINPRSTPAAVKAQFASFVTELKSHHPELDLDWEMYGSVPGGSTASDNWIVHSALRGWEHVEQKSHGDAPYLAGQTDGAALRRYGVPTVRMGWPWPATGSPEPIAEGLGGMGATYVPDLMPCLEKILYVVIDTLTRPRNELGL